jgi:hypothetical protein
MGPNNIITESDMMDIAPAEKTIIKAGGSNFCEGVLTPEAIEVKEALKPTDVALSWDGYFWPLIKKCQYNYNFTDYGKVVEFTIDAKEAPRCKIPKEYYERLKQIYEAAGWKKCVIDLNSSTSTTYIRLYINNNA